MSINRSQISPTIPGFIKLQPIFTGVISLAGMIVIYYSAAISAVSAAEYLAFNVAYGMVSGAIMALAGIAATVANIKPLTEMVQPILTAVPEAGDTRQIVTRLSGTIEINNVTFRYHEEMPYVLNDLSLKIRSGQYIAIVGRTGCGKSTLMRLLLGFETPQRGAIYFDGQDILNWICARCASISVRFCRTASCFPVRSLRISL